ncbi:hypothetical protein OF83DRAFT_931533 [Amylostereum chailletii]|nr:hypothetical protein OF83DRAFT_931533 [Amylostereum chailletii]
MRGFYRMAALWVYLSVHSSSSSSRGTNQLNGQHGLVNCLHRRRVSSLQRFSSYIHIIEGRFKTSFLVASCSDPRINARTICFQLPL